MGILGNHTIDMDHIIRCFKKIHRKFVIRKMHVFGLVFSTYLACLVQFEQCPWSKFLVLLMEEMGILGTTIEMDHIIRCFQKYLIFFRKICGFCLVFSTSLAFLVQFGQCFRCFGVVGGGGGGVLTTPTTTELQREKIYIVEPGRDSNQVKGGEVGVLDKSTIVD